MTAGLYETTALHNDNGHGQQQRSRTITTERTRSPLTHQHAPHNIRPQAPKKRPQAFLAPHPNNTTEHVRIREPLRGSLRAVRAHADQDNLARVKSDFRKGESVGNPVRRERRGWGRESVLLTGFRSHLLFLPRGRRMRPSRTWRASWIRAPAERGALDGCRCRNGRSNRWLGGGWTRRCLAKGRGCLYVFDFVNIPLSFRT